MIIIFVFAAVSHDEEEWDVAPSEVDSDECDESEGGEWEEGEGEEGDEVSEEEGKRKKTANKSKMSGGKKLYETAAESPNRTRGKVGAAVKGGATKRKYVRKTPPTSSTTTASGRGKRKGETAAANESRVSVLKSRSGGVRDFSKKKRGFSQDKCILSRQYSLQVGDVVFANNKEP